MPPNRNEVFTLLLHKRKWLHERLGNGESGPELGLGYHCQQLQYQAASVTVRLAGGAGAALIRHR